MRTIYKKIERNPEWGRECAAEILEILGIEWDYFKMEDVYKVIEKYNKKNNF